MKTQTKKRTPRYPFKQKIPLGKKAVTMADKSAAGPDNANPIVYERESTTAAEAASQQTSKRKQLLSANAKALRLMHTSDLGAIALEYVGVASYIGDCFVARISFYLTPPSLASPSQRRQRFLVLRPAPRRCDAQWRWR